MKIIAIALLALVMGFGALAQDAEAKRMGGGRSTGFSRDSGVMNRQGISSKPAAGSTQTAGQTAAPGAAAPQSGMSRWMGPIAGIAAGLGIAALFSHFGMGAGLGNMVVVLLLVAAAVFAVRLLMRRRQPASGMQSAMQPAMQHAGPSGGMPHQPQQGGYSTGSDQAGGYPAGGYPTGGFGGGIGAAAPGTAPLAPANVPAHIPANVPADFDVEGFLRQSKLNFIRLQAANDRGDMEDIRLFCSPELAAEVQMQYQERNRQTQQTDVLQLNAELLDVSTEAGRMLASVRFSGQIREEAGAAPEAFSEVWHLTAGQDQGQGQIWRIAGIQQDERR